MRKILLVAAVATFVATGCAELDTSTEEQASHSWGGYHWGRTANPFDLAVGDSVSSAWDSYLNTTIGDWSQSQVLNMYKVSGVSAHRKCKNVSGRIEVCSNTYGNNGWLGIAQIWINGGHITSGTTRVNDTYYNTSTYNTPAWRNFVMCQEVGHDIGLDHQDEDFGNPNLGTCMDYTSNPGTNQHPNQHDYEMLEDIYAHADSTTTVGQFLTVSESETEYDWGEPVGHNGRTSMYVKDHGQGNLTLTHVTWALPGD